jgi:hypothetical protein
MKLKPATRLIAATIAVAFLAVAASIPGCSGCSGKAPLAYVPKDAVAVVLVPSIKGAIRGLGKLMEKFKDEAPVKAQLDKQRQQVVKELGFDPEKPDTMKAKGFDPGSGIAFSVAADGESTALVLGVSDQKALEKYLRETFNKLRGGRATFQEKKVGGLNATLLVLQGEQEPRGAWVYHKDHIIICPKSKDGKVAEYAAKLASQESSIKDNDVFGSLRKKIGKHQVMLYFDGPAVKKMTAAKAAARLKTASEWMKKSIQEQKETTEAVLAYFNGAAFGLELSDKGVSVRVFTAVPSAKAKVINGVLSGKGDAPEFGEFIGPDALAVGRVSLNLKKLMDHVLDATPPAMKRRLYRDLDGLERQTKINVEKDVLGLLSGRYAVALFGPNAEALKQGFSLRRPQQALGMISGVAMAQVADTKKAAELLATVERMMTGGGMDVRSTREGETRIYYIGPTESPMVSWTVLKEVAVVGTGDRLKKTLGLIAKGGDNVLGEIDSSRAKKAFKSEDGNVLYYNLSKTADTIRGMSLPAEFKLMLSSVLTTLGKFSDVTWTVEPDDDGVFSELSVRLK